MGLSAAPAQAQNADAGVYDVTDVAVDVTADSAVHARDQAVKQGQRSAFQQLVQRLGAAPNVAAKLSDDDIAALVKSFEVQNERTSAVRYIGTFTVQFRPGAVKSFLGNRNASYTDAVSKPVIVLPVSKSSGHPVLWEETTKWRAAWDSGSHTGGLVPIILPQGGLDDIALLSTTEAMDAKPDSIAALISKYKADSALIAVLEGDMSKPGSSLTIDMRRYDSNGASLSDASVILSVPTDKKDLDAILPQAVKQVRDQLEIEWRQEAHGETPGTEDSAVPAPPNGPTSHLPVDVPIATLAEWEQIRQRLDRVTSIKHAEVITLARGMTNIELEFSGDIPQLQSALAGQSLSLAQDRATGAWVLQPAVPGGTL